VVGWWFSPIWLGLVLSIPMSIWLDRPALGAALARRRIFATPAETDTPPALMHLKRNLVLGHKRAAEAESGDPDAGLARLILDPYLNAAHRVLRQRAAPEPPARREYFQRLEHRLLREGPARLTAREKKALHLNPDAIERLHMTVWRTSPAELAPWWSDALQRYNLLTSHPPTPLAH
jgi:membrane glycosyltransferase